MRNRPGMVLTAPRPTRWPPDDTEESVLGSDLHQTSITNLRSGINEAAALQTLPGEEPPWRAGGQTIYRGFQRSDGSSYQTLPDVFVCRGGPFDILRPSRSLTVDELAAKDAELATKDAALAALGHNGELSPPPRPDGTGT